MFDDPIVNEVRQVRDALARRFNYDVDAILADVMAHQQEICAGRIMVKQIKQTKAPAVYRATAEPAQVRENQ